MSGQKTTNTDEFLIKKRIHLFYPQNMKNYLYQKQIKKKKNVNSIETVLRSNKTKNKTKSFI